jgi:lipid-binding SYLF domain-containing protein
MRAKLASVMLISSALLVAACGSTPNIGSMQDRQILHTDVQTTLQEFIREDPSLRFEMDNSYGFAIFPDIVTAAVGVGGAHGKGEVYQGGKFAGYTDMSQGSIGVQLGGQKYAELILFRNPSTYIDFTRSTFEFQAGASAVVASAGAASTADYSKGVAVFTMPLGGAMVQAAVGGQKFRFSAANEIGYTAYPSSDYRNLNNPDFQNNPGGPATQPGEPGLSVPQPGSPAPI